MRQLMLATATLLSLIATPTALAGGSPGSARWPAGPHSYLYGKIVAVDATAGTVTADVRVAPMRQPTATPPTAPGPQATRPTPAPGSGDAQTPPTAADVDATPKGAAPRESMPGAAGAARGSEDAPPVAPQRTTFHTDAATIVRLDGQAAGISDLRPGEELVAGFSAPPGSTLEQIIAGPAVGISAQSPRVFYGFVGTVTGLDRSAGTLTIDLLGATAAARRLGVAQGRSLTINIGDSTTELALPSGFAHGRAGLADVSVGDIVAAGYRAPSDQTLTRLLALPLNLLIDIPTAPSRTEVSAAAQSRALKLAVAIASGESGRGATHDHMRQRATHAGAK